MREENETIIKALNMYGRVPKQWELLNEIERLNKLLEEKEKSIETLCGIVKELDEDNKKLLNHLKVGVDKE